jgi:ABC-type nitrate/sulfonate/bicarbonate transport system permease component
VSRFFSRLASRVRSNIPVIVFLLVVLGLWQLFVDVKHTPMLILPAPSRILTTLWDSRGPLSSNMLITSVEVVLGLLFGLLLGIACGIAIDYSVPVNRVLFPVVVTSQTIPIFAIAPLLVIWFGFGMTPKVIIVTIGVFFPVTINQVAGLRSVDEEVLNLFRSHEARRWQIFRYARFPASLPYLIAGAQVGVTFSVIGAVFAEWVGASRGIGAYMVNANQLSETDQVFAAIVVVSAVTILLVALTRWVGRAVTPWQRGVKHGF